MTSSSASFDGVGDVNRSGGHTAPETFEFATCFGAPGVDRHAGVTTNRGTPRGRETTGQMRPSAPRPPVISTDFRRRPAHGRGRCRCGGMASRLGHTHRMAASQRDPRLVPPVSTEISAGGSNADSERSINPPTTIRMLEREDTAEHPHGGARRRGQRVCLARSPTRHGSLLPNMVCASAPAHRSEKLERRARSVIRVDGHMRKSRAVRASARTPGSDVRNRRCRRTTGAPRPPHRRRHLCRVTTTSCRVPRLHSPVAPAVCASATSR